MRTMPVFTPTWMVVVVLSVVAAAAGLIGAAYLRRVDRTQNAAGTWAEFMGGPGLLQVGSLAVGMLLACLGSVAGPFGETRSSEASLRQWSVKPAGKPLFTNYIDVAEYRYISLLSRATEPAGGRAVAVLYGIDENGREGVVRRLEMQTGSWSQWQVRNTASRIRIGVDWPDDPKAKRATSVDIALVLDKAAPQPLEDTSAPAAGTSTMPETSTQ